MIDNLQKFSYYCSICKEEIIDGEDYIRNDLDDCAHYDCVTNMNYRDMLKWADCEIRTMESEE